MTAQGKTAGSLRERQRQEREAAILAAAAEVLETLGWRAFSMEAVAERVGIATGTIYLHFSGKDALVSAVMVRSIEALLAFVAALDPTESALIRLGAAMTTMLRRRQPAPGLSADDLRDLHQVLAYGPCTTALQTLQRQLADLIDEGQRAGDLDPLLPPEVGVSAFLALLSPRKALPSASATQQDALVRLYLRGIARDPAAIDDLWPPGSTIA